jgi:glycosyltransferase involved in cell wall biosynthesis
MLIGITRVRNEGLIIRDTIRHFLDHGCKRIILYDDCSEDNTVDEAWKAGGDRISIIEGDFWLPNRVQEETRHRALVLREAIREGADWCLCFDADERLVGSLPELRGSGFRFRLFDGYLTGDRQQRYLPGMFLQALPRMWGPEYRDILMLFRADRARFVGLDQREPQLAGEPVLAKTMVKHFGKCISIEQWEETCDYYATYFPERYRQKWLDRKGKAIHLKSDFGRKLYTWRGLLHNRDEWVQI